MLSEKMIKGMVYEKDDIDKLLGDTAYSPLEDAFHRARMMFEPEANEKNEEDVNYVN